VFQALVAAWGERGCNPDERAALEWLERSGPPLIAAPDVEEPTGDVTKVFVPTNDVEGPRRGAYRESQLGLLPSHRERKPRYFPATVVGDGVCALIWPEVDCGAHRPALEHLARAVTYIGHSSALVRAWLDDSPPAARWRPAAEDAAEVVQLRVPEPGRLDVLCRDFADGGPGWRRPGPGAWCAYELTARACVHRASTSGRLIVLCRRGGAAPALGQTLALTSALRGALLRHATGHARELVSGHTSEGQPLDVPHVVYLPLAFVGADHADGHLLGLGVLLPRETTPTDEVAIHTAVGRALDVETGTLELALPDGRTCAFSVEDRDAPPRALRAATWARASRTFATVTPVVLDRQAPRRHPDRDGFAAAEVVRACGLIDLPLPPCEVRVTDAPLLTGSPHAAAFPPLPTKTGGGRRHVHVWMRFDEPVRGPLVLGSGRYRGYGLFRPVDGEVAS
jgi:CRISPR-associated protein Csb2